MGLLRETQEYSKGAGPHAQDQQEPGWAHLWDAILRARDQSKENLSSRMTASRTKKGAPCGVDHSRYHMRKYCAGLFTGDRKVAPPGGGPRAGKGRVAGPGCSVGSSWRWAICLSRSHGCRDLRDGFTASPRKGIPAEAPMSWSRAASAAANSTSFHHQLLPGSRAL